MIYYKGKISRLGLMPVILICQTIKLCFTYIQLGDLRDFFHG